MNTKDLFKQEAELLLKDLAARGDNLLNTATVQDRALLEQTFTRAAVVQATLFLTPNSPEAKEEMASLVNTLKFLEAKYAIAAAREIRQFVEMASARVAKFLLGLALASV